IPSFARKCWATSSMPFRARTTLAPEFLIFSTIDRRVFSSSSRNICNFAGSRIRISSLTSVFLTSSARLIRAIFASRTNLGFRGGHPVPIHDDRRVDLLLNQGLGFLQELAREDDRTRRAVADLVVLSLRDLHEHLRGRVLDLDLLEDRHPVVRDRHVAKGIDEHLVHALRTQSRLDRICDGACRGDVIVHRAFSLLALGPFLQDNDWLTAHHENSRGSIRGLLYECFAAAKPRTATHPSGRKG